MNKNEEVANIIDIGFTKALEERYLAYALSTIKSRSLPDVRDGLKPVHRRLLYAMKELNMDPKSAYKKCARVVGDVIGKFHPHGEMAIYETLVRLAQEFSVRYPLIDGQGNFGSIDGDNAAAMRYTESRMAKTALYLLNDIDRDTVNFKPTYDGFDKEPEVLPAAFPNILANGSEGIAVGMATYIPPHNMDELCQAVLQLLKKPSTPIEDLIELIPGPDFPTGGLLIEPKENIINAYKTGRGSMRLRAKWHREDFGHGLYRIVITEIPFQVKKSKLIEKMAELYREKKLMLVGNFYDESADTIRLIIEPRARTVEPEMLMESLFRVTDLEIKINLNLNVLDKNSIPKLMNLKEILECFIEHRKEVVLRRSQYELDKINSRLHLLDGFIIAYLNLDELIDIIRKNDEPKPIIMSKWGLSEIQADAILNMRLRSLRKLEEFEIKKEKDSLGENKDILEDIINNPTSLIKKIREEISALKNDYSKDALLGPRRTEIINKEIIAEIIPIESYIEKEAIAVALSKMNWIRSLKGHNINKDDLKYKEGDEERFIINCFTTDKLVIFSSSGKSFTLTCDKLPRGKNQEEPVKLMIDLGDDDIVNVFIYDENDRYFVAANNGKGFVVPGKELLASTKNGKQILNCQNSKAFCCLKINGDAVAIIGENRKLLVFKLEELPEMKRGQGVTLQKYQDNTKIADLKIFNLAEGLTFQVKAGDIRCEKSVLNWLGKRASVGKIPPVGFSKANKF